MGQKRMRAWRFLRCLGRTVGGTAPVSGMSMPVAGRDMAVLDAIQWEAAGAALPGQVPVFDWEPDVGDLTVIAAHPDYFFDVQLTVGYVMAPSLEASLPAEYNVFWSESFTTGAESAGGSSGGPLFDSERRWVGILVGRPVEPSAELSIAIPMRDAQF